MEFQFPHCDPGILHAPEDGCKVCNESGLQDLREAWKINFTGHHDSNKTICPAERDRSLDSIYRWPRNRITGDKASGIYDNFESKEVAELMEEFIEARKKDIEEYTDKERRRFWGVDD